jgi:small-conductance mechanosensitive channel
MDDVNHWLQEVLHFLSTASIHIGGTTLSADALMELIVVLVGSWWGARWLEGAIIRLLRHRLATPGAYSAGYAIGRLARYAAWIVGSLLGLQLVGLNLSNFALVGGALGIGIGFGLQNIVGNFVSGVILLVERSLKVGDFVDLASGVRGTVTEIAVRYTRITTNWTLDNRFRRINVPFSVAYGSDKNLVREAALEAAKAVPLTITDTSRRTDVWFTKFAESALEFQLVVWIGPSAVNRPGSTFSAYLWALDDALRARGIELPFPQRDIRIRSVIQHTQAHAQTPDGPTPPDGPSLPNLPRDDA